MREENILRTAREEGIKEGIAEGTRHGLEQGTLIGAETSKIEVIKNMLAKNTDHNFISEITGKTIEEVKEIAYNM